MSRLGALISGAKRGRALLSAALDVLVSRYVPDCLPVVFDAERTARWAAMVDAATVVYVRDAEGERVA